MRRRKAGYKDFTIVFLVAVLLIASIFFLDSGITGLVVQDESQCIVLDDHALVLYWNFDSQSYPISDLSGHNLNGEVIGSPEFSPDTPFQAGQSIFMNGADDFVQVQRESPFIAEDSDFTVLAWVKSNDFNDNYILSWDKGIDWYTWSYLRLERPDAVGAKAVMLMTGDDQDHPYLRTSGRITSGQWTHIALVFSSSQDSARLFINGAEVSEDVDAANRLMGRFKVFGIGENQDGAHSYKGLIDGVYLFSRALSRQEISAYYESVVNPACAEQEEVPPEEEPEPSPPEEVPPEPEEEPVIIEEPAVHVPETEEPVQVFEKEEVPPEEGLPVSEEVPCIEDWVCSDWSDCWSGVSVRECLDLNFCGTEDDMPVLEKTCSPCTYDRLFWGRKNAYDGEPIRIFMQADNCHDRKIILNIYETGRLLDDKLAATLEANLVDNRLEAEWTAVGRKPAINMGRIFNLGNIFNALFGSLQYRIVAMTEGRSIILKSENLLTVLPFDKERQVMPKAFTFNGDTTDFRQEANLREVSNLVLEKEGLVKIEFLGHPINVEANDFDSYVDIKHNFVDIDTEALPNLKGPARITFYNLDFEKPIVLRNGKQCPPSICKELNYNNGVLRLLVTKFSNYTTMEFLNTTGLVLYWSFENETAPNITDDSGNGFDGIFRGDTPTWSADTPGLQGLALEMDGSNDYVSVRSIDPYLIEDGDNYTIMGWFKSSDYTANTFMSWDSRWTFATESLVSLKNDDEIEAKNIIKKYAGYDHPSITVSTTVNTSEWHHIALVTINDSGSNMSMYIDGQYVTTGTPTPTANGTKALGMFGIGYYNGSESYSGLVDDVYFFDRDLSASEISTYYRNMKLPFCGNGSIDGVEECDDGNLNNSDGCSDMCEVEDGWICMGDPSECSSQSCSAAGGTTCTYGQYCLGSSLDTRKVAIPSLIYTYSNDSDPQYQLSQVKNGIFNINSSVTGEDIYLGKINNISKSFDPGYSVQANMFYIEVDSNSEPVYYALTQGYSLIRDSQTYFDTDYSGTGLPVSVEYNITGGWGSLIVDSGQPDTNVSIYSDADYAVYIDGLPVSKSYDVGQNLITFTVSEGDHKFSLQ